MAKFMSYVFVLTAIYYFRAFLITYKSYAQSKCETKSGKKHLLLISLLFTKTLKKDVDKVSYNSLTHQLSLS